MKKGILTVLILTIMLCMYAFTGETISAAETTTVTESDIVYIPDAEFKRLLNEKLGVEDQAADITKAQLETITYINEYTSKGKISDLTGIEYCTNLNKIYIVSKNAIADFSPLAKLPKLNSLKINLSEAAKPDSIFQCENLTYLTLIFDCSDDNYRESNIDLSNISNLEQLTLLALENTKSDDYSPIKDLINLESLYFNNTDMKVLPDLSKCSKLTELWADRNYELADISGVKGATSLKFITFDYSNQITDMSSLFGMTNLTDLHLEEVTITKENEQTYMETISSLINLEKLSLAQVNLCDEHTSMFDALTKLEYLDLAWNEISDVEFLLKHKDNLKELSLYSNHVSNNHVFEQMTALTALGIGKNDITDFSFISKLPNLTNEYIGKMEWHQDLPTTTYSMVDLVLKQAATTYKIKNDVKDENGNYVAPVESEYYTYDEDTQIITLDIEKLLSASSYKRCVSYTLKMTTAEGNVLHAAHRKSINFCGILNVEGVTNNQTACIGDTITLTAGLGYGMNTTRTYTYAFYKIDPNTQKPVLIRDFEESNQFKYRLEEKGFHQYVVTFKDQYGNHTSSNIAKISVSSELMTQMTVNGVSKTAKIPVGASASIKVVVTFGGNGGYTYQFIVLNKQTGQSTVIQNYTGNLSFTYNMTSSGEWEIFVKVKDHTGIVRESNHISVIVYEPLNGKLTVNGSTDAITKVQGNKITLKAEGFDGSGDYTYKFAVLDEKTQSWYVLRDFNKSDSYTYSLDYTGKKQFAVTVKDSAGNTVAANRINVTVKDKLSGKLTVGGSTVAITKKVGESITLSVSAAGGMGNYTYKFAVFNEETGKWTVLQDFSKNSSYTTLLKTAGVKQFAVTIKDSQGNTVATNRIIVTVKDMTLKGNLTINGSADPIVTTKGSKITLKATVTGGSEKYTYKFAVLNVDTGSWVVLKDFSEASTYIFTCNYPGKKQFAVTVKDSTGKTVATNRITVTVTK